MSRTYDFVLRGDNGRYERGTVLSFPSATTIISAVYAKPQLVPWTYRQTLDGIAGALDQLEQAYGGAAADRVAFLRDLLDTFKDADMFDEWIRDSAIHADDVTNEAAKRGTAAHELLASLVKISKVRPGEAMRIAERTVKAKNADPFKRSVAGAWVLAEPKPLLSEQVVVHLGLRYAGRLDYAGGWTGFDKKGVEFRHDGIVDLKTRRADLGTYKSDEMQTGLYKLAAVDMGLMGLETKTAVLLAGDDGEPARLVRTWVPDEAAIKLVELYWLLRRTDANGRKVR